MEDVLPICMIFLDVDHKISGYNELFKQELDKIHVLSEVFTGDIKKFIHDFSTKMYREKTSISFGPKVINCIVSYYKTSLLVEIISCIKPFIRFVSQELRTPVTASIELIGLMNTTKLSVDQQKYVNVMKENGIILSKITNNTIDYLKIFTGLMVMNVEEFSFKKAMEDVKKYTSFNKDVRVNYDVNRDAILTLDYKKFIETMVHIVTNSIKHTKKGQVNVKSRIGKDLLTVYITDTGPKLSTDTQETMFLGFLNVNYKPKINDLVMAIAKGLARLNGGDLVLESTTEYGNAYKYTAKIKDFDSD